MLEAPAQEHHAPPPVAPRPGSQLLSGLATKCLLAGLIVGIFALSIPYPVLAALGASVAVFACLWCVRPIHRVAVIVLANYLCWVLSGLLSGGLDRSELTGEFWRGEGRCFLFYLPLLAISFMAIRRTDLQFIVKLACALTVIGAILCVLWLVGLGHFQAEIDAETGERTESKYFVGFLTSHTGAGAFWATVTAFLAAYSMVSGERRVQLLALVAAVLTLGTGGRAATLGLIAMFAWLLLRGQLINRRTVKMAIPVMAFLAVGGGIVVTTVPEVSERMGEMFEARTMRALKATLREPTLQHPAGYFYDGAGLEHHNLVTRVYLWKYALHLFQKSPLVGIGFGRFNDTHLEFAGIPHVIQLAVDGEVFVSSGITWEKEQLMISTGNAHNSYFHMLAETGIVGLGLLIFLWVSMYRACSTEHLSHEPDQFETAYCLGCRGAIICLLFAALPGHALAAPSGGILLTTMVGAWIGYTSFGSIWRTHEVSRQPRFQPTEDRPINS